MSHSVTIRHNFETAHRLPNLGGKCQNLHGHSWWCEITVMAADLADGTVVEFGAFKAGVRRWIDGCLDHGCMLGAADPLVLALTEEGSKVYRFGAADPQQDEQYAVKLGWPTVENVAALLGAVGQGVLESLDRAPGARVTRVSVTETHVNAACWNET